MIDNRVRLERGILAAYAAVLLILYLFFHNAYLVEYLDNAWTFSWAWGWWENGDVYDRIFGYIDGDGGTALFSRTFVFVYGAAGTLFGWSREVGFAVSTLFTLASAALWYAIILRLGYRRFLALSFALVMLLLELYFAMAHKIRVEALGFFIGSAAFYLFIRERYLLSGLLAGVAFETHPYAAACVFWILAYLVRLWPAMKAAPRRYLLRAGLFILGGLLGLGYWFLLHGAYLGQLGDLGGRAGGNAWWAYYFNYRFSWRRWPELFMIILALGFYLARRGWKKDPFIGAFLGAVLLVSVLIPRGNQHYVVYLYPAAILLILTTADSLRLLPLVLIGLLCFELPQYAYLFYTQRGYDHQAYMQELRERVPDDAPFIYGHPGAWFALKERNFHAYGYFNRAHISPEEWPDKFILIENREYSRWYGKADIERDPGLYERHLIDEWKSYDGSPVRIWRYERTGKGGE